MIYTVTFNPAIDYIVKIDALVEGMVNRSNEEEVYFGGKGVNVSLVLNTLNIPSIALGFTAGFTGEAIKKGIENQGVKTDFVNLDNGFSRINVKIKSEKETDLNGQGPKIDDDAIDSLFSKLEKLEDGDVLVLAGSIPNTLPENIYEKILESLKDKGVKFIVDATGDLLANVLKYKPFLVKPNNHELGELFGKVLKTDQEIVECAKKLQDKGAQNVLVSMAGDGAILIDENGQTHKIGVPTGKVVNSVGAGDSMVAGFLAGFIERKEYDYALQLGTAAGSATAFSSGLATKDKIDRLLSSL